MNGGGDRLALMFHMILWWSMLICIVDTRGSRGGKFCHRYCSKKDDQEKLSEEKGIKKQQSKNDGVLVRA